MILEPLPGKIIIKPSELKTETSGGLLLPPNASKDELDTGEVVAIGQKKQIKDSTLFVHDVVKINDKVILKKYGPDEVKVDGQTLLVAELDDLVAIIR